MKNLFFFLITLSYCCAGTSAPVALSEDLKQWDCDRKDIPPPETSYPLDYSRIYLVNSYYLLFHMMIAQEDTLYAEGLRAIAQQDLQLARSHLMSAIEINPSHIYARLQLAFIYLWQGNFERAKGDFFFILQHCPCNEWVLEGLYQLAMKLDRADQSPETSYEIYRILSQCVPDSFAYKFGLARSLARRGEWQSSLQLLDELAQMAPDDSDVQLQKANIFLWQKEYDEAESIFIQYSERVEGKEGLAKIAMRKGDVKKAQHLFYQVIQQDPNNYYAIQNLARSLAMDLQFTEAKKMYETLHERFPHEKGPLREWMDVKLHTDPTINYNLSYVEAKENDPDIKKPVVRDYYFDTNATIFVPLRQRWRVDLKTFFAFQKEKNILANSPGINFNAQISGAGIASKLWFAPLWRWDLVANVKRAWNVGSVLFPFQRTTRFEPATQISYTSDSNLFSLGAGADSYVIKNFTKMNSQLLTLTSVDLLYRYTAPIRTSPEFEIALQETFFESIPRNRRDTETTSLRFLIPFLEEYFKAFYTFEHRHYRNLNINYYSFFEQWRNTFGLSFFIKSVKRSSHFEVTYWHRTQGTKDLFQPIGDFVYIAPWQFLKCNQFQANYIFWMKESFKANISGGYYRDTLPYRAWNLSGQLFWVF